MGDNILFALRWNGSDAPRVVSVIKGYEEREKYWLMMQVGLRNMVDQNLFNIADLREGDIITLDTDIVVEVTRYENSQTSETESPEGES